MNKEIEAFVDKFIFPVANKFECDVEYAARNKEVLPKEEVAGFLRLSLMRSIEDLSATLISSGAPKESISEIVKGFANGGRDFIESKGLPPVKLDSFGMVFVVKKARGK
jgi:hypothetical protein